MTSGSQGKVLDLRAVFGLQATVTTPSEATGGAYVGMDVTAQPGSATKIHYHPEQEETYRVLEGTLEVFRDDRWRAVPAGSRSRWRRERYTGSATRVRRRSGSSTCTAPRWPSRSAGPPEPGGKDTGDEGPVLADLHVDVRGRAPAGRAGEAAAVDDEGAGFHRLAPGLHAGRRRSPRSRRLTPAAADRPPALALALFTRAREKGFSELRPGGSVSPPRPCLGAR